MRKEVTDASRKFAGYLGDMWLSETEAYELYMTIYQTIRMRTKFGGAKSLSTTNTPTAKTGGSNTDGLESTPAVAAPAAVVAGAEVTVQS